MEIIVLKGPADSGATTTILRVYAKLIKRGWIVNKVFLT